MANLTIAVSEDILRRARLRAVEQHTSVNALLADFLAEYGGPNPAADALDAFLDLAEAAHSGSGGAGRAWTRDDLHDRANLR